MVHSCRWDQVEPIILDFCDKSHVPWIAAQTLWRMIGSVSHELILDVLSHCKLPQEVISYIANLYSKLTAYVKTKKWSTHKFKIIRGVFQGDTLSPLIFLIAFNPIIQLAQSLNTCGFHLRLPSTLPEMPKNNSYIYALWDEPNSNEPMGWYLAKVISIESGRSICLKYRKGSLTEAIKSTDLNRNPHVELTNGFNQ